MLNLSILSILHKSYWHRDRYLPDKVNKEMFIVVTSNFPADLFENEQICVRFTFGVYRKHFAAGGVYSPGAFEAHIRTLAR